MVFSEKLNSKLNNWHKTYIFVYTYIYKISIHAYACCFWVLGEGCHSHVQCGYLLKAIVNYYKWVFESDFKFIIAPLNVNLLNISDCLLNFTWCNLNAPRVYIEYQQQSINDVYVLIKCISLFPIENIYLQR